MLAKNRKFIIIFITMNLIYLIFILGSKVLNRNDSEVPSIKFDNDVITVSVKDGESELLEGVSAYDKEDGDLSKNIFIYSTSTFDKEQNRTITYAVFDSDNQMVTASRKFNYNDYEEPKFSSSQPLINVSLGSMLAGDSNDTSFMSATSSVDGNISNKISMSTVEEGTNMIYKYSVTDSTGTTSTLEVSEKISLNSILNNNIDIELKNYILYVDKGTVLNTRSYIKNIKTSLGKQNELKPYVQIETNYDSDKEGTYEVRYTLNRSNGDYGLTKMIVVVE